MLDPECAYRIWNQHPVHPERNTWSVREPSSQITTKSRPGLSRTLYSLDCIQMRWYSCTRVDVPNAGETRVGTEGDSIKVGRERVSKR
ncbi:hypothetical protein M404DRAFT_596946 [Pisolithus tinctorius Marx 270]|uniref:Uncharacterized protein n=1 Tax=Pisolithus tinctorius Marx 270 TaxID=870435 RepID=A0A0C3P8X1_PISTI|nr:hypothetical protein M404DRAFT_596946 [Pisolithus tinctorius Marx 270]